MRAVVFDTTDPRSLATFWSGVTGAPISHDGSEFILIDWQPALGFQYTSHPTVGKNKLHLDLLSHDQAAVDREVERIVALGATRIGSVEMRDVSWVVLADPDGNEFCLYGPLRAAVT